MTPVERFHARLAKRNHRARALKNLLTSVGVSVPKNTGERDKTRKTFAVDTLLRLMDAYGADNLRLALRLLVETSDGNARQLRGSVITAMTILVARHPDWAQLGLALFDAMDRVDVGGLLKLARRLTASGKHDAALLGLIAGEVRRHLGDLA